MKQIKLVVKCRSKTDHLGFEMQSDDKPLLDKRECSVGMVADEMKGYRNIDIPVTPEQLNEIEVGQKFVITVERA